MREAIREIFAGAKAPFTGKLLASFLMLPMFFASVGASFPAPLSNVVDESAIYDTSEVSVDEIKEPDAGNSQVTFRKTPVGIAERAPVSYDLVISGKVATNVVGVGLDSSGAVAVPGSSAGYYNANGSHLLVGHNTGVFAGLSSVVIGETIEFRGENYQVTGKKVYDYDPSVGVKNSDGSLNANGQMMYESLYSGDLALMTCHGSYVAQFSTYNQRLVVFTQKI